MPSPSDLEALEVLPPVRTNVFKHSLLIVGLYVVVGIFMMIAVFLASGTTPKAIHLNYDSISAASQMNEALSALKNKNQHQPKPQGEWIKQFDTAIRFEEGNITEAGESDLAKKIRVLWNQIKLNESLVTNISDPQFQIMSQYLRNLTEVNEQGMFNWVARSNHFSQTIFLVTLILFIVTILIALLLADSLAVKIATPLRELSAALKKRPEPGAKLELPVAKTLEIRILTRTLKDLWQGISKLQALNLEEISMQRKKLETVLASVEDAILVVDNQNRVAHCNEGFLKFLNLKLLDLIHKPWNDLPSLSNNYLSLRSELTPKVFTDQTIELDTGVQKRLFAPRYRAILDEKEIQIGNLYLLHDVTEIKQKDRLRAEFIGVLSHELKTPLQSLGTASELLLKRKNEFGEENAMLIQTIHEDMGRIRDVANEFIQVGVSNLHSLRLKMEPTAIDTLIPQWLQPFYVLLKERNVKIEVHSSLAAKTMIRVDTVKFSWAITNLLSNAIRVSPSASVIEIQISEMDQEVRIEIKDQGPGIPIEIQKRMFEPYFQGGKSSGFLGLGLTITKEVVEAHLGTLHYEAGKHSGSIFRINLPKTG